MTVRSKGAKHGTARRSAGTPPPVGDAAPLADAERLSRIAVSAYFRAQTRDFAPGAELDDWLWAEREIGHGSPPAAA